MRLVMAALSLIIPEPEHVLVGPAEFLVSVDVDGTKVVIKNIVRDCRDVGLEAPEDWLKGGLKVPDSPALPASSFTDICSLLKDPAQPLGSKYSPWLLPGD
jgi:hypothetical protein